MTSTFVAVGIGGAVYTILVSLSRALIALIMALDTDVCASIVKVLGGAIL